MEQEPKNLEQITRIDPSGDLVDTLATRLKSKDLQTLLLHVFDLRSQDVTPEEVRRQYESNRFVQPAKVDQARLVQFDNLIYNLISGEFEGIELSSIQPLGLNLALSGITQKNILSTNRGTEVIADVTTALALETARRRKTLLSQNIQDRTPIKLCSSQRCTRTQFFEEKTGFTPHFQVFGMCTAYRRPEYDPSFDMTQYGQHIEFYLDLLNAARNDGFNFADISVKASDIRIIEQVILKGHLSRDLARRNTQNPDFHPYSSLDIPASVASIYEIDKTQIELYGLESIIRKLKKFEDEILNNLKMKYPWVQFSFDLERSAGIGYYEDLCFKISATNTEGATFPLVDGGSTDWNKKLLRRPKEQLITSGFGSELFLRFFS